MTGSHVSDEDPWDGARTAQREEVRAIWAGRGAPAPREPRRTPRRRIALISAGALAVVAVIAFVFVPAMRDDADEFARRQAAELRRAKAAERARLLREGIPVRRTGPSRQAGEAPLAHRERLVAAGEAAITADARRRVASGEMRGPVAGTRCRTFPFTETRSRQEADAAVPRNHYQCIAFSRRFALPELEGEKRTGLIGQPYWLVLDYRSARMTFCRISPRAGEGGRVLVEVPVDPACGDPLD